MRLPVDSQNSVSSGRQSAMSAPDSWRGSVPAVCWGVAMSFLSRAGGWDQPRRLKAFERGPMTSALRTSVQYIQISETQTTPYISMKHVERMPVRSCRMPNMMGNRKPPKPPASPTIPEMTPMLVGNSSEMYLNTDALPNAQAMPMTNISAVNDQTLSPTWKVFGPSTVAMVMSVC